MFYRNLAKLLITTSVILGLISLTTAYTLGQECENNPSSPACLKPYYADDLSEYKHDLRASWILNNGKPDETGPTVFEGGAAGNLTDKTPDTVTGDTKTESYIENPGQAGTNNFGRGNQKTEPITITGAKKSSNNLGDYLINQPYQGQCGDGQQNTHPNQIKGRNNCPEDYGLPDVPITGVPDPKEDNYYKEAINGNENFKQSSVLGEPTKEYTVPGSGGGDPDYIAEGAYIKSEYVGNSKTHLYSKDAKYGKGIIDTHYTPPINPQTYYESGSQVKDEVYLCTARSKASTKPISLEQNWDDYSEILDADDYDASRIPELKTDPVSIELEYVESFDVENRAGRKNYIHECDDYTDLYETCDGDPTDPSQCKKYGGDYFTGDTITRWESTDVELKVKYENYYTYTSNLWGPVNDKPGIFDNAPNLSRDDVTNSAFGYHTNMQKSDSREGGNNKSVSANRYEVDVALNPSTGDQYFEADRNESYVADADGPDGENNIIAAFKEGEGVQGMSDGLDSEIWQGASNKDYVNKSVLERKIQDQGGCDGSIIRCVFTVDVTTKGSGWSSTPADAKKIVLN